MRAHFAALLPLLLVTAPLSAQEKHTLRFQFVQGTTTWMLLNQEMQMHMNMGGQDVNTTMSMQMWSEMKVLEVKDGVGTVETTFRRVKVLSENPMMQVDYDSDVKDSDPGQFESLSEMIGKGSKVKIDASGKVLDMTMDEGLDEEMKTAGMDLKQMFQQGITVLPAEAIAIGDSWASELEMPMGQMGKMKAVTTNKLKAVEGTIITLEQDIKMDTASVKMPGGMKMDVTKSKGSNKIDLKTGSPVEMVMDMEMDMVMGEQMTTKMVIKQSMKQVPPPAPKKAAAPAKAEPATTGK